MDPRLLRYFSRELQFIREMGGEFAREFPKVAGRLGLDGFEVADPYVERLLEGFAFLAGRVQLKIDDEFPRFTQHLLGTVYPHYLAPTPSMAVVQMRPDLREGALAEGVSVPRDTVLRGLLGKDEQTACEYRTAHEVVLWPLEIVRAEYRSGLSDLAEICVGNLGRAKAALRLRMRATAGLRFEQIALERLPIFLRGPLELTSRLYEQLFGHVLATVTRPGSRASAHKHVVERSPVRAMGFDDDQALLPYGPRSFQGYRLLHEYFACPERYLFAELAGLAPGVRRCAEDEIEVIVLFDATDPALENAVEASNIGLFCTPAVNLFPRRADRIHLAESAYEYHVVPDRTRPMDFEVHTVTSATGYGTEGKREFLPFYACTHHTAGQAGAYYTLQRRPRKLSERQRVMGARSSYVGSETFIALVDADEGPYRSDLKQLGLETLCTNRDLPLHLPLGQGRTDFTLESGAPVESVRCVAGPTPPRASHAHGDTTWRLISHLSLTSHSLTDAPDGEGASALRELLALYSDLGDVTMRSQVEAVVSASSRPVVRHLPFGGVLTFGRGTEVTLTCDETGFPGRAAFLFGAVVERFFARYASINSFTETVLRSIQRGEIMRWSPRIGRTPAL